MKLIQSGSLLLVTIIATLAACSHGPAIQEYADTANPAEEVAKLDADITSAVASQVNVLAPASFAEANEALKSAKKSLDQQKKPQATLHQVANGRAYLKRANEFAQLSHANIEEVIIARKLATEAGAPSYWASDFRDADASLKDVTSDIEKNDLAGAIEKRSALQLKYLDLELRAIKQAKLGQARDTVAQAVKEGAKEFAPRSLAQAEKSVQDTDAFITANRHDAEQINLRSGETRTNTEHLLKITRDSKAGKKTSSEEMAIKLESEQIKVATKQSQIVQGESANEALEAKNDDLESEQALTQRFDEARAEFSASEAEVYKQGNTLMIRLRGLEFPVSQAVLKGSNFPLLAKVQKVIRSFGRSSVVVEGHTDSNGGKALNERLSADRAQAVRQYLVANGGSPALNVRAVGYDYQKPLATNKTADGRAQNRRVDVLISPDSGKFTN